MNTKSIIPGTLVEGSIINNNTSTDDIKQLKAQLQEYADGNRIFLRTIMY